ncbi:hypothetical protein Ahy_B09g095011 [Arachis hypogaea]|uniref:SWIM-type domain-containing protein n=1 Tax=Arachis hypogaea TaxID=3818 RepID=A0A444XDG5_ARAHY|nr:hypothetical protein Ahy_B09g095011 [Arachis hypogaea]
MATNMGWRHQIREVRGTWTPCTPCSGFGKKAMYLSVLDPNRIPCVAGIPCVHACAVIARVNKWPADFCHKLLTMESGNLDSSKPREGRIRMRREHEQKRKTPTRPGKLPLRRRSPTPTGSASFNPMEGASEATAARLANFLKFVPTTGFKPPKKK